jgi:riboflavin synthase
MFTGLVQDIGTVRSVQKNGDWVITIETALDLARAEIGASISCAGVCLTITSKDKNSFTVQASEETLSKTVIGTWQPGTKINLEPSLRMGDELGGHFVFGHVDGVAKIAGIEKSGDSHILKIEVKPEFAQYLAPKGSVSLDGTSLTVNEVAGNYFTVNVIPHSWEKTTLGLAKAGDSLHLEIDMLARYVANMLRKEAA